MTEKPTAEKLEQRIRELEEIASQQKEAEAALRNSEKRLEEIIQANPIPTFVIDKTHTITHCNKAYEKLTDRSAAQIIGTHEDWLDADSKEIPFMADFILDAAPEEEMRWCYGGTCRKSTVKPGAYEAEIFYPRLGEKGKWLFLTAAPLKDSDGNVFGAVETLQDITERRQTEEALHESEKRLSQIVQVSPIPAFVIDDQHIITHCNKAYEMLTGISARKVIGTRAQWMTFYKRERPVLADFIVDNATEEDLNRFYGNKYKKSAVAEGAYEAEDFFPALGEKGKWIFFTAAPLRDDEGKIIGALETLQDVSERRLSEEALRQSETRYRTLLDFAPYPIVVFTLDGRVSYLNPAFTEIFGWTREELEGKKIDYVPPGLEEETSEKIRQLFEEKVILREETKRLTRDGRVLDVIIRAAVFSVADDEPAGELVILRDITREKRIARQNEAMLRISMALPLYHDLENLLTFINGEVKKLLDTEGAIVVLHDEIKQGLFIHGAAYDDTATQRRSKDIRFSMDQLIAGRVIQSGEPLIVSDTSKDRHLHEQRDRLLGYRTRDLALLPLKSSDRIIGALCAINKKEGQFDRTDIELLEMIAGTVALSIENARFSEEVNKAYMEVRSLNRAKDKVINHLSHELRTPVAILSGSLDILAKRLSDAPEETWKPTMERIQRNLDRIVDIQHQVHDIMENKQYKAQGLISIILDECADEIETLIAKETGEGPVIRSIRERIDEIFGTKETVPKEVSVSETVSRRLELLKPAYSHRELEIISDIADTPPALLPHDVLQKVVDGLIKNAVENTPDEGKIEITVQQKGNGSELIVHDYGVGITDEARRRIFEGFFTTQDTMAYSSKRPFDFNAGGKGADLLRMKIFSERYHFNIEMTSTRCAHIPEGADICPGRISQCPFCSGNSECHRTGGT
ncbi:MAG: PAS domain S-box protein, partial [Deltaproteobacteria bacterium]|nr:PAS domain S-box protein [Deltaproteobacteria bacterium]